MGGKWCGHKGHCGAKINTHERPLCECVCVLTIHGLLPHSTIAWGLPPGHYCEQY